MALVQAARAALVAYSEALKYCRGRKSGRVLLKTSSQFFVQCFAKKLGTWQQTGYKHPDGKRVRGADEWKSLVETIADLRRLRNTRVYVWGAKDEFLAPLHAMFKAAEWETGGVLADREVEVCEAGRDAWIAGRDKHLAWHEAAQAPKWV